MSEMKEFRSGNGQFPRWRLLIVLAAICALTGNLAARTEIPRFSHGVSAYTHSPNTSRQRLERDAEEWVVPLEPVRVTAVVSIYPRVAPAGPPIPSLFFEEVLYNRPPPAC